jgi:hypothetical protein
MGTSGQQPPTIKFECPKCSSAIIRETAWLAHAGAFFCDICRRRSLMSRSLQVDICRRHGLDKPQWDADRKIEIARSRVAEMRALRISTKGK